MQKIFLEKTKGLDAYKRLALMDSNSAKIMTMLRVKEQIIRVVTGIPTTYAGCTGCDVMNLIDQSPSILLENCQ